MWQPKDLFRNGLQIWEFQIDSEFSIILNFPKLQKWHNKYQSWPCHQLGHARIGWRITVQQKLPKSYFQTQFSMLKINLIFQKKISSKNINLGDHFFVKTIFSRFNFWTNILSKIMPNFWWTDIPCRIL